MKPLTVLPPVLTPAIDRRDFVCAAATTMAALLAGCAPALMTHHVTPVGDRVDLELSKYPALLKAGGSLSILPEGARHPINVLAEENETYVALSPVCTHAGCIVDVKGDRLVCPCHGSAFDRQGMVLEGPASTPLQRYETRVANGVLTIQLSSRA